MLLITRFKVGTGGAHSLWLLLIGIVIISSEPVRAHAPPRSMYYGHRVEPREPFKHIPSSLMFDTRDRLYDRPYDMPTCSQLRNMWKTSIKNLRENNVIINNNNNLDSNEIPLLLNNPYYMAFLWQQSLQHSKPNFGKIVSEPTVATRESINEDRVPVHHHTGRAFTPKSSTKEEVPPIPGHFMDQPSKIGVVYGHVIHSPDEAEDRRLNALNGDKHQRYRESGTFGDFVTQLDDSNESNGRSTENNNNNNKNNNIKQSSTVKQQRTGSTSSSNSFSTAEDFFKSGVWHEKPIIPSVSFQRFH